MTTLPMTLPTEFITTNPGPIEGWDTSFWTVCEWDGKKYVYCPDWEQVRLYRPRFCIHKATQAMWEDISYHDFMRDAQDWVPLGAFCYFQGNYDGADQAKFYLNTVAADKLHINHTVDVEYAGAPWTTVVKRLDAYIQVIKDHTGKLPIIYTADWFWKYMPKSAYAAQCDLWVAEYTLVRTQPIYIPKTWSGRYKIWQYNPNGKVKGFRGSVDVNRFHGSEREFNAFLSGWGTSTPPGDTTFPLKAIVIVNSLWIRSTPGGTGIGGLKYGDTVMIYALQDFRDGGVWARISPVDAEPKWACVRNKFTGEEFMRFIP